MDVKFTDARGREGRRNTVDVKDIVETVMLTKSADGAPPERNFWAETRTSVCRDSAFQQKVQGKTRKQFVRGKVSQFIATNASMCLSRKRPPTETPWQNTQTCFVGKASPDQQCMIKCKRVCRESAARKKLRCKETRKRVRRTRAFQQKHHCRQFKKLSSGKTLEGNSNAKYANSVLVEERPRRKFHSNNANMCLPTGHSRAKHVFFCRTSVSRQTFHCKKSNGPENASRQKLQCETRQQLCRKEPPYRNFLATIHKASVGKVPPDRNSGAKHAKNDPVSQHPTSRAQHENTTTQTNKQTGKRINKQAHTDKQTKERANK